ncbi:hypothetical protein GQ55_3G265800 [Panicum hallii var. hallii]|uniref:Uncharacterized protein n=1 Tax=Panicum hallii var. hallii TaxID=1504633 RepID=A0A2T7EDP0_9POAL|nr:hypothetical protein GQ55_3G265800 [Panicum hallii var. hallii]
MLVCFRPVRSCLVLGWVWVFRGGGNGAVRVVSWSGLELQIRAVDVASQGWRWLDVGSSEEFRIAPGFACNFMCPAAFLLESPFLRFYCFSCEERFISLFLF